MADPLSIAASVVGLLAAAGKVYGVLSDFVTSTADAPKSAASTLEAVEHMKFTLSSVQSLIESLDSLAPNRKALIQLDHLSIVITHSVLTISELESIVCLKDGLMHRFRWAWSEKRVLGLLPRLESQKNSLALMVAVLQSKSDTEALNSHDRLLPKVDEILQQNEALAQGLQRLEEKVIPDFRSIKFLDDASSQVSRRLSFLSIKSAFSVSSEAPRRSSIAISNPSIITKSDFEVALEQSRVYSRTQANESDVSFTTSTAPTNAWTMLSGMSLNDISIISAFRLPITLDDIDLVAPGSTFSVLLTEQLTAPIAVPVAQKAEPNQQIQQPIQNQPERPIRSTTERGKTGSKLLASVLRSYQVKRTIKIVVVGDSDALKSKMLQTYAYGKRAMAREYMPKVFDNFIVEVKVGTQLIRLALYDTSGQESYTGLRALSYQRADLFLVLTPKRLNEDFRTIESQWIPEIIGRCPGTPFLIVATHRNLSQVTGATSQRLAIGDQIAERTGAVAYTECDVDEEGSVRAVFNRAILVAMGLDKISNRLKESLRFGPLELLIESQPSG
ncbi:hypothetical protein FDECE_1200 [Fusarium decemcellulare]|nr:hypothetical protein FDECE_1200 [Fusarium decemcellulare]